MIITAVERTPRRRGRVDVSIDGARCFEVGRDVARERGLRPGLPIDAAQVEDIVRLDLRRQAMRHAAAMLVRVVPAAPRLRLGGGARRYRPPLARPRRHARRR